KKNGPDAFAEIYLAEMGSVQRLTGDNSLPPTLVGAKTVVVDGKVWSFGGLTADAFPDAGPMVFEVDGSGTIKARQALISPEDRKTLERVFHSATPLSDGKSVLIAGGYRQGAQALDTWALVEINADTISITARGKLSSGRIGHEATLIRGGLLRGSVLVTGGLNAFGTGALLSSDAELFLSLN
ncbi:MAG: hypothetical protein GXP54_08920, partial [Deltaproteobacteria bacterium]|nr:hypothetical protein [Deltaproteobacteria bacterium]